MAAKKQKSEIITFKADHSLIEALRGIPNRSEFIRSALLSALHNICPLCGGTGLLTPGQMDHWNQFAEDHRVEECEDCHEIRLVCQKPAAGKTPQAKERGRAS